MFIPALNATVAELDAATKNRHSHRALAAAAMRERLVAAWGLAGEAAGGA
jgi:XTP/dITP diphosphohydrolase